MLKKQGNWKTLGTFLQLTLETHVTFAWVKWDGNHVLPSNKVVFAGLCIWSNKVE